MKPAPFEYCRPDTVDEAIELMAEFGGDASVISGGMSLGAMLNMRLVRPTALVDINWLDDLATIRASEGEVETGAVVRQAAAMSAPEIVTDVPLLVEALPYVGHYQTRSRGTLGGSVAHADPSAEIPLCLVTLDGAVTLSSSSGRREVGARDFFQGILTTDRNPDELITGLTWPGHVEGTAYAFEEISQRQGDFAIVAIAVAARVDGEGMIAGLSMGLGGVEDRPVAVDTDPFSGAPASDTTAEEIADATAGSVEPVVDLQANSEYRRQLVRVLGAKALSRAFRDARTRGES